MKLRRVELLQVTDLPRTHGLVNRHRARTEHLYRA